MKKNENNTLALATNSTAFATQLSETCTKRAEINDTIAGLSSLSKKSATVVALLEEQYRLARYQLGYTLGLMKAYIDTLPAELAAKQKINGIPVDLLIKIKVDEEVLNKREASRKAHDFTYETEYWKRYRRLSESICGYGYNMYFIEERYHEFYPEGIHDFVSGFANGYSNGFHTIATEAGITDLVITKPVEQDIWKNWPFFLNREVHEYRLDGKYLYMYHGGWNCSGDRDMPYGDNVRMVNHGVYEKLQARPVSDFVDMEFNFGF